MTVGAEAWTFVDATLSAWQMPMIGGTRSHNLQLIDEDASGGLLFSFALEARPLALEAGGRHGTVEIVDPRACDLATHELGQLNPRTTVIELIIDCAVVPVPGLARVSIGGTVVVERLEWPE